MRVFLYFVIILFANISIVIAQPMVKVQLSHPKEIKSIALSINKKYLITGYNDGVLKLWDVASKKEIRTYNVGGSALASVAFNPFTNDVFTTFANSIHLFYFNDNSKSFVFSGSHKKNITSIAITSDGSFLLSGDEEGVVALWNVKTAQPIWNKKFHDGKITKVIIDDSNNVVFSSSLDKTIKIHDLKTAKNITTLKEDYFVYDIDLSSDKKSLLIATKSISLKNINNGNVINSKLISSNPLFNGISKINFSRKGNAFAVSTIDGFVSIWDSKTFTEIKRIKEVDVNQCLFFDDNIIITANKRGVIKFWTISDGNTLKVFSAYSQKFKNVQFSNNGKFFIATFSKYVQIWDFNSWRLIKTLNAENEIYDARFSPDDKYIITASRFIIQLWDANSGMQVKKFVSPKIAGYEKSFCSVGFSGNNGFLSILSSPENGHVLNFWNIEEPESQRVFNRVSKAKPSFMADNALVVTNDAKYALSAETSDYAPVLWDIAQSKEIKTFPKHNNGIKALCISDDLNFALSGSKDKNIKLLAFPSGKEIRTFSGHSGTVNAVAFLKDNKSFLSASDDRTIKLWNVQTGEVMFTFIGHEASVNDIVITPDGNRFISVSDDGSLKLWDINKKILLFSTISDAKGQILTWTPDGFFLGAEEFAKQFVYITDGLNVINIDQLFEKYYRPDIIKSLLVNEPFTTPQGINTQKSLKLPPEVEIIIDENNLRGATLASYIYETENKNIELNIKVVDNASGISELKVFLNDKFFKTYKPSDNIAIGSHIFENKISIPLNAGNNTIKAIAFNQERTESLPAELTVISKQNILLQPDLYILAVGVNNYKNSRYNLNYAINDAYGFTNAVKKQAVDIFKNIYVASVYDEKAIKINIQDEFEKIKNKAQPNDVFIFYYAGHGVMSAGSENRKSLFYLVLHDITKMHEADEMLADKGFSSEDIVKLSSDMKAQKQLFVLDACQSGGALQSIAMRGASEEKAIAQLARSTGTFFIAASGAEQYATEVATLGHGIFTYALIKSLEGTCNAENKSITVNLVKSCVEQMVPELTLKYKGQAQYPTGYGFGQDFPIGVLK